MRLAVNIDHFATLREARESNEPEPVLAALLSEQAGAEGIVCHIRSDRRHIKERDLMLLRQSIKTKLIVEMAATKEMEEIALEIKPDIVSLVPEKPEELTTEGGLDIIANKDYLLSHIKSLQEAGIKVSIFVDPNTDQIEACKQLNCNMIEINTGLYADLSPGKEQQKALDAVINAAKFGFESGLKIHAGHGLDYKNIHPIAAIPEIEEFSIGFSIVARAAIAGIEIAVRDMLALIE
jgi:pyridoxine 5-phosphate synthase